jgi:hypothetical protein
MLIIIIIIICPIGLVAEALSRHFKAAQCLIRYPPKRPLGQPDLCGQQDIPDAPLLHLPDLCGHRAIAGKPLLPLPNLYGHRAIAGKPLLRPHFLDFLTFNRCRWHALMVILAVVTAGCKRCRAPPVAVDMQAVLAAEDPHSFRARRSFAISVLCHRAAGHQQPRVSH